MKAPKILVLGCGFTGERVARQLVRRGAEVVCTNRTGSAAVDGAVTLRLDANDPVSVAKWREALAPGLRVLYSIPSIKQDGRLIDPAPIICKAFEDRPPARVVYLSTTGIYGDTRDVNEFTPPAPRTEREMLRAAAERTLAGGPWTSLILRPAAIYGPGRGVHTAVRTGIFRVPPDASRMTSRIHVDDLAEHAVRALFSELRGAYPVADEEPCSSLEVAQLSAKLLGVPLPPVAALDSLSETRRANRRVDGSAIRRLLGITLCYPSFRVGIPACLEEEARTDLLCSRISSGS